MVCAFEAAPAPAAGFLAVCFHLSAFADPTVAVAPPALGASRAGATRAPPASLPAGGEGPPACPGMSIGGAARFAPNDDDSHRMPEQTRTIPPCPKTSHQFQRVQPEASFSDGAIQQLAIRGYGR